MKTLPLEEIYADPHKIDAFLASGESVTIMRDGVEIAELAPFKARSISIDAKRPQVDYRARFLEMWGPNAFRSEISVAEEFDELRRERRL